MRRHVIIERHGLRRPKTIGVYLAVQFVMVGFEQYMQVLKQRFIVAGHDIRQIEICIQKTVLLGIIPINGDRRHYLFAPFLVYVREIIIGNTHALHAVASANKVTFYKTLQILLVIEEIEEIDVLVLFSRFGQLLLHHFFELFKLFGFMVRGCNRPVKIILREDFHYCAKRNKSYLLRVKRTEEFRRQVLIERALTTYRKYQLNKGIMECRRCKCSFLGFRPKDIFNFRKELLPRLRNSYTKINVTDEFATVIVFEKILAHVINNRAFFVFQ